PLPPPPRRAPHVEVTYCMNPNGIVNVSAKDRATGRTQASTITAASGLAKEEVERMVQEAQAHAEEDKGRRDEIEARNRADSLIYTTEKTLQESKDKLPEAEVKAVTEALDAARKAVEDGSRQQIEAAVQELTRASHRMAETLYQRTASSAPPPAAEEPKPEGA